MDQKNRDKALESALSNIEKQFGKGSLMKLGDDSVDQSIEAISTGSIGLGQLNLLISPLLIDQQNHHLTS